jgi:hypothetical protein
MKKLFLVVLCFYLFLSGCNQLNEPSKEKSNEKTEVQGTKTTEDVGNESEITSSSTKSMEQKVVVTEEEKAIFKESLFTHLEGISYLIEDQVKIYKTYALINGLAPVKQVDIENSTRIINDISVRLNIIRSMVIPEDAELKKEYNDILLQADNLHIALQKGQTPLRNNYATQLNSLIENEINPLKQFFYSKFGFVADTQEPVIEERDKINEEAYDPNIPFSDQREEIYGDMECGPPNYCEE